MACAAAQQALATCKRELGLHPKQCYPPDYRGQCDQLEYNLKRCLAHDADPRSAAVLYDPSRSRAERVAANQRLQAKLKKHNQPCTP